MIKIDTEFRFPSEEIKDDTSQTTAVIKYCVSDNNGLDEGSDTEVNMSTQRTTPIEMNAEDFRTIGHHLVNRIAEFLESISSRPVTSGETPTEIRDALNSSRSLPHEGTDPAALVNHATDLLFNHSLFNSHPRFWGYITAAAAPIGILGDLLASAVNQNTGAWFLSPMASEIESQTIRWIAELLGYPVTCGGLLVSGGNMANIVCLLAARQAKAQWDVRASGLQGKTKRLRIYCSSETHTWIQKAADITGIGTNNIRWIDTDSDLRMDAGKLRKQIAADRKAGDHPLMVVGTAGSVSTGAIDPLREIAKICRDEDIWFHVDGAYGGFAAILPDASADLRAISEADSLAVDAHKWLYAPLEAGCVFVRDSEKLREAFAYHPTYYHFGVEAINYIDYGPQNSRGLRALKVWLALQHVGRKGYQQMLGEDIQLSIRAVQNGSEGIRAGTLHAIFKHHYFSLHSSGSQIPFRQLAGIPEPVEQGIAFPVAKQRHGLCFQRSNQRELCPAVLHRKLPHFVFRYCRVA